MKIACYRLTALLLSIIFAIGMIPLATGAIHMDEAAIACEASQTDAKPADTVMCWGFEGLALLFSAFGALVRQVIRIRNG